MTANILGPDDFDQGRVKAFQHQRPMRPDGPAFVPIKNPSTYPGHLRNHSHQA